MTTGTKWKYPQLYFTVRMVLVLLVRWLQSLNMQITFSKSEIAWQIFEGRWSAVRTLQPFCTVWRYHPVEGVACRLTTSIFSTTWLPSIMVLKLHVFRGIIFTCTWESSLHFNTMSLPFVLVFQRSQVKKKKALVPMVRLEQQSCLNLQKLFLCIEVLIKWDKAGFKILHILLPGRSRHSSFEISKLGFLCIVFNQMSTYLMREDKQRARYFTNWGHVAAIWRKVTINYIRKQSTHFSKRPFL